MATTLLNPILLSTVMDPMAAAWAHQNFDFDKNDVILRDQAVVGSNWSPIVLSDGRLLQMQTYPRYSPGTATFIFVERREPRKGDRIAVTRTVGTAIAGQTGKVVSVAESGKRYRVLLDGEKVAVDMDRPNVLLTTPARRGANA